MEIREVHPLGDEDQLYEVQIAAVETLPDGAALSGAILCREVFDGASGAFSARVLRSDATLGLLFVERLSVDPPSVGPARVHPFDYLAAPSELVSSERLSPLRDRYARALAAVAGAVEPRPLPSRALPPSWGFDRVCLWGPPGTGKTYTLGQKVASLLRDPSERVLVVSTTNRATDTAAVQLGLAAREQGVLLDRIKRAGRSVDLQPFRERGLESILPISDPARLDRIERARSALDQARGGAAIALAQQALTAEQVALASLKSLAMDSRSRALLSTSYSALSLLLVSDLQAMLGAGRAPFTTVVIDEAGLIGRAQAAALSLLAARRLVLIGDPRQLSPIARASRTLPPDVVRWLASSGLDHLGRMSVSEAPGLVRLTEQYRMHPDIRQLVSAFQYDGALRDADAVSERRWEVDPLLRRQPRAVWYVADEHPEVGADGAASDRGPGGRSRVRQVTSRILGDLVALHPQLRQTTGLFITPFIAQARKARGWLQHLGLDQWQASTVHAQQGAQAQVVVFDTVHASSTGWPAAEWKRLVNVGLSRAEEMVLVIASRDELDRSLFRELRDHLVPRRIVKRRGGLQWEDLSTEAEGPGLFNMLAAERAGPVPIDQPDSRDEIEPPTERLPVRLGEQIAARRSSRPVLSAEQRRLIDRDIADAGPRLVRGVAGSGKTLVLAHWVVRTLRGQGYPTVAVLYGNQSLRPMIEAMIDEAWRTTTQGTHALDWDRVELIHIGVLLSQLEGALGLEPPLPDRRYEYGERAQRVLGEGLPSPRFDALFIDEAQDFGAEALRVVIGLTREREGRRAVLIFYDNAQNLYQRRPPSWKELGVDMRGRSDVMRESFRSTRPVVEVALNVLDRLKPLRGDEDMRDLEQRGLLVEGQRQGQPWWEARFCSQQGEWPTIWTYGSREEEFQAIAAAIERLIRDEGVSAGDIRVVMFKRDHGIALVQHLERHLSGLARAMFLTSEGFETGKRAVVVTTAHSFKGYEAEVVFAAGIDAYARSRGVFTEALYVALTRARSILRISGVSGRAPQVIDAAKEVGDLLWGA